METPSVKYVCGHLGDAHAIHRPPYGGCCTARGCRCAQFVCPECGEVYGVHTARCQHTPRVPWPEPTRE